MTDLGDLLKWMGDNPLPFMPTPWYNKDSGEVSVWFENVEYYADFINHNVTVFRARDDNRIVGCDLAVSLP
jgi:hypothetical protein